MLRRRVLLAHHFFHPDDVVSARLFTDLALGLTAAGWEVTALASDRAWSNPEASYPPSERYSGITIERVHRPAWDQSRPSGRLANSGWMVAAWLRRVSRMAPFDAVVVGSDPSFAPLILVPLRHWWPKVATAHWCYDVYPEAIAADDTSRIVRTLYPLAERLMAAAYRRCDAIVDLGPCMRKRLAKYDSSAFRATVSPWALVEPEAAPRAPDPRVRQELFGSAKLGLLYSGTLGRAHDFHPLLSLARACRARSGNDIAFCFSCRGHRLDELKAAIVPRDSNIRIAPFCAEGQLASQLEAAELHLLSLQPAWSGLVVPSKFFGSLSAGRPILYTGPLDSDIAHWISTLGVGYVAQPERLGETVEALHKLAASPDALRAMQRSARQVYDKLFCKAVGLAAWDRLLSQLVGREALPTGAPSASPGFAACGRVT